ncbi:MAG: hypothetical protein COB36_09845 [Alphaproteobacteria bacterium]|nr:MAG: hypothetical protein COB36_09845 [Alphaproteobacteria bacterium]
MIRINLSVLALCLLATPVYAHQPVMDMAPRWQNGWGFQLRHEVFNSDILLDGDAEVNNFFGREKSVGKTWLEGIYTFRREVRLTFKLPSIDQSRTVVRDGVAVRESGSGVGDLVIGLPLKRYENNASSTGNLAFTPSIRLPTGSTSDDFEVGDGSTDLGVSFSASFEKADLYQFYDLFYWANGEGDNGIHQGDELGLDINIGWHPYHDNEINTGVFLMFDVSARHESRGRDSAGATGGDRLSTGPVFVWYRSGMMFRAEYKVPIYENLSGVQLSRGNEFSVGIGFVF